MRADKWVVAGTGGTGVSAVEIILRVNQAAHVTMVGMDSPAGLLENGQFRKLAIDHGDEPLQTAMGLAIEGSHRLHVRQGRVGVPIPLAPEAGTDQRRFDINSDGRDQVVGTGYIAAIGRVADYPPIVRQLIDEARRAGGTYRVKALFDPDQQYTGYRVTITIGEVERRIEVTGAASRYLPVGDALAHAADHDKPQLLRVQAAENWDAPPESGNYGGGFAATAAQTARFARYRNTEEYKR